MCGRALGKEWIYKRFWLVVMETALEAVKVAVMEAVTVAVMEAESVAVMEAASMRLSKPMTDIEETGTREMNRSVVFAFFLLLS